MYRKILGFFRIPQANHIGDNWDTQERRAYRNYEQATETKIYPAYDYHRKILGLFTYETLSRKMKHRETTVV